MAIVAALLASVVGCSSEKTEIPTPPPRETGPPPPPFSSDISHQRFRSPLAVRDAERILLETEVFEHGSLARQIHAFNVLLDQPDAVERFQVIAERARLPGQLYALCAFELVDPARAEALASRLGKVTNLVYVNQSDWGREQPVSEAVTLIRKRKLADAFRKQKAEVYRHFGKAG